jgi:hypothetical protein
VVGEELQIAGGLVVLPDAVGHGETDVALQVGGVGEPVPRLRVEVRPLALLTAVAPGLPREHGAPVPGRPGRASGGIQTPHPVEQQGAGEAGHPQREHREHEQLVPEDVSAVGLAVQTSGGDARIEICSVGRHRLQDVECAQP